MIKKLNKRNVKSILKILAVVILLSVSLQPSTAMGQFFFMESSKVGDVVDDFTVKTLEGEEVTLSKHTKKDPIIIFFWATWCPHCRKQLQEISKNIRVFDEKGIKVVLVDVGEDPDTVRQYAEKHKINIPILLDQDEKVSDLYELVGLPTFFFVNRKGIVTDVLHSLPDEYEEVLDRYLGKNDKKLANNK